MAADISTVLVMTLPTLSRKIIFATLDL